MEDMCPAFEYEEQNTDAVDVASQGRPAQFVDEEDMEQEHDGVLLVDVPIPSPIPATSPDDEKASMIQQFRELEKIPASSSRQRWASWMRQLRLLQDMTCVDLIACARSLRLLALFAQASEDHRRAVEIFIDNSDFLSQWGKKTISLLTVENRPSTLAAAGTMEKNMVSVFVHLATIQANPNKLPKQFEDSVMRSFSTMNRLEPFELSSILWSLAMINICPTESFWQLWSHQFKQVGINEWSVKDASNIVWSWAQLRTKSSDVDQTMWSQWRTIMESRIASKDAQLQDPANVIDILWSLGECFGRGERSVPEWVVEIAGRLFVELEITLDTMQVSRMVETLRILSPILKHLNLKRDSLLEKIISTLRSCSATDLCDLIQGLADIGIVPSKTFLSEWTKALRSKEDQLTCANATPMILGFHRWKTVKVPEGMAKLWLRIASRELDQATSGSLEPTRSSNICDYVWALGQHGVSQKSYDGSESFVKIWSRFEQDLTQLIRMSLFDLNNVRDATRLFQGLCNIQYPERDLFSLMETVLVGLDQQNGLDTMAMADVEMVLNVIDRSQIMLRSLSPNNSQRILGIVSKLKQRKAMAQSDV
eukprot:CAMPEP_0184697802 /NCGR_PEP_ID=MMETSP0313-20130426/4637_1 /TAXON_ID=2792 /ORGANISM="Porphyridium aerugineum, Strain SAG 1380-2" /LENGTH=594 /DNA_ID=CAMNT_0027156639 /DNA_START=119 /DNA_END=1904 /DNA_ORIENTATION=+